jgi:hypothetical protein
MHFVRKWPISDKPTALAFVGYWTNNGQRSARRLNGSATIDLAGSPQGSENPGKVAGFRSLLQSQFLRS